MRVTGSGPDASRSSTAAKRAGSFRKAWATPPGILGLSIALIVLCLGVGRTAHALGPCGQGPCPPKPPFLLVANEGDFSLAQGSSTKVTITVINRLNPSSIGFTIAGLPPDVTFSFSPELTTGNETVLTLTASVTAPLRTASLKITGSASGCRPNRFNICSATLPLLLTISLNPTIDLAEPPTSSTANLTVSLAPCSSYKLPIKVVPQFDSSAPVNLSAGGVPAQITASFNPASFPSAKKGVPLFSELILQAHDTAPLPSAGTPIAVNAGTGSIPPSSYSFLLAGTPGFVNNTVVDGESSSIGFAPQLGNPGSVVQLLGAGFCPGSTVQFGTVPASATSISPLGNSLVVDIPAHAGSSPLTVNNGQGSFPIPNFTVLSYRSTDGFSFANSSAFKARVPNWSFGDISEAFGYGQTHWCTFDEHICRNPVVEIFILIADNTLNDGHCFGFALGSQRLWRPVLQLAPYPPPDSSSVWDLTGPDPSPSSSGASDQITHFIHIMHVLQLSDEFINAWLSYDSNDDLGTVKQQVIEGMRSGALITMHNAGSLLPAHVVVPWNLEEETTGAFAIDVYDPNLPYTQGEDSLQLETNLGQIDVGLNKTWSFNNGPQGGINFAGGLGDIEIIPFSVVPVKYPTFPGSPSGLAQLIADGVLAVFSEAAGPTQIADDNGRTMFKPDGSLNVDPNTRLPRGRPFGPLNSPLGGKPLYLLGGSSPYTLTLAGKAEGAYDAHYLFPGLGIQLRQVRSLASTVDKLKINPGDARVDFITNDREKPVNLHVISVIQSDQAPYDAVLATTVHRDALFSFAFDKSKTTYTYSHRGAATQFSLKLAHPRSDAPDAAFQLPMISVADGDTVVISPNWAHIEKGNVPVKIRHAGGREEQRILGTTP